MILIVFSFGQDGLRPQLCKELTKSALSETKASAGHSSRNSGRRLWSELEARLGQDHLQILPRWHEKMGKQTELVAVPGRVCQVAV